MKQAKKTQILFFQGVPTLGFELEFAAVARNEGAAKFLLGNVSDHFHIVDLADAVVVGKGDGEQELVVLASVEGTGGDVQVELLSRSGCLVVERNPFLVDAAPCVALAADVHQFAAESVADVHHRGGTDACLGECLDDVASGFWLELTLEQVFFAREVGLDVAQALQHLLVALLSGFSNLLVVDGFLAFEQLQAHVGGSQVARNADEVVLPGSVAIDDIRWASLADGSDADGKPCEAAGRVASHDVDVVFLARKPHACIEFLNVLDGEPLADGQRDGDLLGRGVHGVDVAQVHDDGLVAQVFEGHVGKVEMDAFHQDVCGDERVHALLRGDDGAIVAYSLSGSGVGGLDAAGEFPDEAELS